MIGLLIYAYGVGSGIVFAGPVSRRLVPDGDFIARAALAVLWPFALVLDYCA